MGWKMNTTDHPELANPNQKMLRTNKSWMEINKGRYSKKVCYEATKGLNIEWKMSLQHAARCTMEGFRSEHIQALGWSKSY